MKDTAKKLSKAKKLSEMTTEDLSKFLESVKADSLIMFTDPDEQRKYVESARNKLQQEMLEEKVMMTDDDQLIVIEKSTRKLKRVDLKNRDKSRAVMGADNRTALTDASPTLSKIFDRMRGDRTRTNRERVAEEMRSKKSIEQLEVIAATLESLSREQQTTSKILEEIRKQVSGSSGGGDRRSAGSGIGSALLRTIVNNPGIAILAGVGAARAIESLMAEREPEARADEDVPGAVTPPQEERQIDSEDVNRQLREAISSGQITREQANDIARSVSEFNSTPEQALETLRETIVGNSNRTPEAPPTSSPPPSAATGGEGDLVRLSSSRTMANDDVGEAKEASPAVPVINAPLLGPARGEAKDSSDIVSESVREQQLLAKEYENNPALFSNRNLVLRARKVTFSGDAIRFKLPGAATTMSTQMPQVTPVSMPNLAGLVTEQPAASPAAREPAMTSSGSGRLLRPTSGRISSPFGMRAMGDHRGIDFAVPVGTPVVAAHAGTIVEVRESPSYGNMIRIRGNDGIDTLYAHLSSFGVQQGQQVAAGQQIALSGNTGRSTGPHLHFEAIRNGVKIDPAPLMGEVAAPVAQQAAAAQTPEPSPTESDAAPAQTPGAATPTSESSSTPAPAQILDTASSGAAVESASMDNAVAERTPAAPTAPSVIDISQPAQPNPSTPPPTYDSSDPNDPGRVEPEDAAERYSMLFNMAA